MRRRVGSAVVVAAVAAVVIVALVDAVRPLRFRSEPAEPLDAKASAVLAELGFRGTLVYTDQSCAIRALALPGLKPAPAPEGLDVGCEISLSPDGRWVAAAVARWSPDSSRYAVCRGTRVDVHDADGGSARGTFTGCAPAWRPDGTLTLARDLTIREARLDRVLVPSAEVERSARSHPNVPPEQPFEALEIRDVAWLSRSEVAALIAARFGPARHQTVFVVAGFEGGRFAWRDAYFGRFDRLVVSPGGDVLPEPPPQPFRFITGRLRLAGPFAWSPDGRGMALASRASIVVVDLPSERHVRVRLTARDLAWR